MKRILLFALVFVLAACAGGAGSEYSQNLAKWQDASIDHYRFTLSILRKPYAVYWRLSLLGKRRLRKPRKLKKPQKVIISHLLGV